MVGRDIKKSTHRCTPEELGLRDKEKSMFMPIHEQSKSILELYHRKMICLDKEDLKINGNFDTSVADLLNIQLIKC